MTAGPARDPGAVRAALAAVTDPEIPVLTIEDLGVLRDVRFGPDGRVEVILTPTYSGCPAIDTICSDVTRVLAERGYADAVVRTELFPPWTTDGMSDDGRRKLVEFGIAPPGPARDASGGAGASAVVDLVRCPRCGSAETRLVSRFGSTPCKSLRSCGRCLEPFDHFKPL